MSFSKRRFDEVAPPIRHARRMQAADARQIASWMEDELPVPKTLSRGMPALLSRLVTERRIIAVVVEELRGDTGLPQLAAFGLSGFVSDEFLARHLAHPTTYVALSVLSDALRDKQQPALLTTDQIAWANAAHGLNVLALSWLQNPADVTSSSGRHVLEIGHRALLDAHRGYQIKCVLKETSALFEPSLLSCGFRRVNSAADGGLHDTLNHADRVLLGLTRDEAKQTSPGTPLGAAFSWTKPRCGFTRSEQLVLELATEDATDTEIAAALKIGTNAVKERWRLIYQRVGQHAPFVFRAKPSRMSGTRGGEKRRGVIRFVREHPEELRHYDWGE